MTDLPAGYRWANAIECESGYHADEVLMVPLTEDVFGVPYEQDEADVALPITVPVMLDVWENSDKPYLCTDEFDGDDHGDDHSQCQQSFDAMNTGYDDDYSYGQDIEYQNYMHGSGRF